MRGRPLIPPSSLASSQMKMQIVRAVMARIPALHIDILNNFSFDN